MFACTDTQMEGYFKSLILLWISDITRQNLNLQLYYYNNILLWQNVFELVIVISCKFWFGRTYKKIANILWTRKKLLNMLTPPNIIRNGSSFKKDKRLAKKTNCISTVHTWLLPMQCKHLARRCDHCTCSQQNSCVPIPAGDGQWAWQTAQGKCC